MGRLIAIFLLTISVSCSSLRHSDVALNCNYICTVKNTTQGYNIALNGNYYLINCKSSPSKGLYKSLTDELIPITPEYKHRYFDFYYAQKTVDAYQIIAESFVINKDIELSYNSISYLFKTYKEIDHKKISTTSGNFYFNDLAYEYITISLIADQRLHRFTFFCKKGLNSTSELYNEAVSQVVTFNTSKSSIENSNNKTIDTGLFHRYNYYSKIDALKHQNNQYNEDINNTLMSYYFSFIGENDSAKYYNEIRYDKYRKPIELSTQTDSLYLNFKKYSLTAFVDDKRISDSKILILNEAHHLNINRDIARLLLPLLKNKGYNYFAVEGIINQQTIDEMKKPSYHSGYYMQSRNYTNLVVDAIKLGFKIISYDDTSNTGWKLREFNQAKNIYNQTFNIDSNAKVFVYCGYDHARKDTTINKYLAHHLQKLSGKNAISIRQSLYYNHFFNWMNSPEYISLQSYYKEGFPYVVEPKISNNKYDFDIVIPNTSAKILNPVTAINITSNLENINYHYILVFNYSEFKSLGDDAIPLINCSKRKFNEQDNLLEIPKEDCIVFLLDNNYDKINYFVLSTTK